MDPSHQQAVQVTDNDSMAPMQPMQQIQPMQHVNQTNYWTSNAPETQYVPNQPIRPVPYAHSEMLTILAQPQPPAQPFQFYQVPPAASCVYYANNPVPQNTTGNCTNAPMNSLCCCQRYPHGHPCFAYYFGSGIQPPATNFATTPCQVSPYAHLQPSHNGHAVNNLSNWQNQIPEKVFDLEVLEIGSFFLHDRIKDESPNYLSPRVRLNFKRKRVIYEFTSSYFSFKAEDFTIKSEPDDLNDLVIHQSNYEEEQRQTPNQQQAQPLSPSPQLQLQQQQNIASPMPQTIHQQQSIQQQQVSSQVSSQGSSQNSFQQTSVRNFAILIPLDAIRSAFRDSNDIYLVVDKLPLLFSSDGVAPQICYETTSQYDPTNGHIKHNRLHRIRFRENDAEKFFEALLTCESRLRYSNTNQKMVGPKEHYYDVQGLVEPDTA